jgi:hypothetical protein
VRKVLVALLLVASMMTVAMPASACWPSDDDCTDNDQCASNNACINMGQQVYTAPFSYTSVSEMAVVGQSNTQIATGNVNVNVEMCMLYPWLCY